MLNERGLNEFAWLCGKCGYSTPACNFNEEEKTAFILAVPDNVKSVAECPDFSADPLVGRLYKIVLNNQENVDISQLAVDKSKLLLAVASIDYELAKRVSGER